MVPGVLLSLPRMQLEEGQALLARVSRGHQGTLSGIFLQIIRNCKKVFEEEIFFLKTKN